MTDFYGLWNVTDRMISEMENTTKEPQSKDVQAMVNVLKEMGIEEYEPKVLNQLLEFSYRYVTTILDDARAFSSHAAKKTIDTEDIKAAIRSKVDYSFTATPPRELLIELSKSKNKNPLPQVKYSSSIKLPADRFCLHGANYKLKSQQKPTPSLSKQTSMFANNKPVLQQQQSSATATASTNQMSPQSAFQGLQIKRRRDDDEDYDM